MYKGGTCSNHTSTPLTQTASPTMDKAGLDISTSRQTLADTLTDAASIGQFGVLQFMNNKDSRSVQT